MKKIKVGSDFSGIGAFNQSLKSLGVEYDEVFACDMDRSARLSFLTNYGNKKDIEIHNSEDCKKINDIYYRGFIDTKSSNKPTEEEWEFVNDNEERIARSFSFYYPWNVYKRTIPKEPLDIYMTSPPCFTGDTLIKTDVGYKEIKDIQLGDLVLTHENKYQKVVDFGSKKSEIYELKAQGILATKTTANHRYYVRKMSIKYVDRKNPSVRYFSDPEWVEIKNLTPDHFIGINIPNIEENPYNITEELAYVLGRYVADGWYRNGDEEENPTKRTSYIILAIGKNKLSDVEKIKYKHYLHTEKNGCSKLHIYDNELVKLILDLGLEKGATNKKIPNSIINLPKDILLQFFNGYMDGDGHINTNKKNVSCYRATSVSKELLMGLQLIIAKLFRCHANIKHVVKPSKTVIQGRIVNQRNYYVIEFRKEAKKGQRAIVIDDKIWYPIHSIEKLDYEDVVYDITVENDHSFTANQAIVHNCQSFSFAGKRLGKNDRRGILFWNSLEFIRQNKPRSFIFENVKGLLSDDDGHTFNEWIVNLGGKSVNGSRSFVFGNSVPYNIHYKVINAKDHGIPQNRERIFIVGFRDDVDMDYKFPDNEILSKKLSDLLDSDVDEKYYLSQSTVDRLKIKQVTGRAIPFYGGDDKVANCLVATYYKTPTDGLYVNTEKLDINVVGSITGNKRFEISNRVYDVNGLSPTIIAHQDPPKIMEIAAMRGRPIDNVNNRTSGLPTEQIIEVNSNGLANTITTVTKDNLILETPINSDNKQKRIRKLTPRECHRLMGFPEDYICDAVADTHSYKQAGNSIYVRGLQKIIANFNFIKKIKNEQIS